MPDTCDPSSVANEATCFDSCIPPGLQEAAQIVLLLQLSGLIMTPQELANAARCFNDCIPKGEQLAVQNYLLCQILLSGGGGGGGGGVTCGSSDPVDAPLTTCALYYNTTSQGLWYWDSGAASWIPLIA